MERRDLLRALGTATTLAFFPHDAFAAWERVAAGLRSADSLSDAQRILIRSISDAILPRTGSPGATDVGVPAFVEVIVSEQYPDSERGEFLAGLNAIGEQAARASYLSEVLDALEAASDRRAEPVRTYWRLKSLIVHGYFTSEPVMRDVLHFEVMPGRFDGAAPVLRPSVGVGQGGGDADA